MTQKSSSSRSGREVAIARRRVQYQTGKAGLDQASGSNSESRATSANTSTSTYAQATANAGKQSSRQASLARRHAMSSAGKAGIVSKDRTRADESISNSNAASVSNSNRQSDCGCGCKAKASQDSMQSNATDSSTAFDTNAGSSNIEQPMAKPSFKSMKRPKTKMTVARQASF